MKLFDEMANHPGDRLSPLRAPFDDERPECDLGVFLAAERTFLAWIRTGVSLMAFGFVVARFNLFLSEMAAITGTVAIARGFSAWLGAGLAILGMAITAAAGVAHITTIRALRRREVSEGRASVLAIVTAILLVMTGVPLVWHLLLPP